MAEFNCFLNKTELVEFLANALRDGFTVWLNKNYPRPTAEPCANAQDIRAAIENRQFAFLLERPDFTRYPLSLRAIERHGQRMWYPRAKEGGPMIEVYFFEPFTRENRGLIPCSLLSYHPKIIVPTTGEFEATGEEVKRAFGSLCAGLRGQSRRVRSKTKTAYVMPGIEAMLAAGWSLAEPFCT